ASMEPRPSERGNFSRAAATVWSSQSFNGATSFRTWKRSGVCCAGFWRRHASMEPRPSERGNGGREPARANSPFLPQPLLDVLQFAVNIRVLPAEPCVKAFGYTCYVIRYPGCFSALFQAEPAEESNGEQDN